MPSRPRLRLLAAVVLALVTCIVVRAVTMLSTAPVTAPQPPAPAPVAAPAAVVADPALDRLIDNFTQADFPTVHRAYQAFQRDPDRAIPALIALLERDDRVDLVNTADLYYPGATRFYGHGWIVSADIDWISVRAGWMLETLAFEDFGFSGPTRGRNPQAAAAARAWWNAGTAVSRRAATLAALDSSDADRRVAALSYLANLCTEAPIPGLDGPAARRDLEPRLRRLSTHGSADERERAHDALAYPPWRDVCND